jgi:hypothetical protein
MTSHTLDLHVHHRLKQRLFTSTHIEDASPLGNLLFSSRSAITS